MGPVSLPGLHPSHVTSSWMSGEEDTLILLVGGQHKLWGTGIQPHQPVRENLLEGKQPALKGWKKEYKIRSDGLGEIVNLEEHIRVRALSRVVRAGRRDR